MNLAKKIKTSLENKFGFDFNVSIKTKPSLLIYSISIVDSSQNYFTVCAEIKDDTRLTIEAEPEKYGIEYLHMINNSTRDKRETFVKYWELLNKNKNKVYVKINEINYDYNSFIEDTKKWETFFVRSTKSPFFVNEKEKEDYILENISLIVGMMLSLVTIEVQGYCEGTKHERTVSEYERNPINRELCLAVKGYTCACCGFNFQKVYGEIGEKYIEVHHIIPVSQMGDNYVVDPIKDLVPLCSNCHSMIHKKNPPYTVEELKKIIEENKC